MTISEIAKLAGVSSATVSRYLNNGYVSTDKKEKIRIVIEKTGYKPSMQAQMLRTRKSKLIGVVLPKIDSESISRVVAGISSVLSSADYELLLADTENSIEQELNYLTVFENRVDGIIFIATILTPAHKTLLKKLSIPVVMIGQNVDYISCIYHDDYHASFALTSLFIEAGAKELGYIGVTPKDIAAGKERLRGFQDAMTHAGLKPQEAVYTTGPFTMESGYNNAKLLCGSEKESKVQAIFCATDQIAVGAISYCKDMGYDIPEAIKIGGIGHTRMSRVITPALTTVHYHYKTSGVEAAHMILGKIQNPDTPNRNTMLGYEIIKRDSI